MASPSVDKQDSMDNMDLVIVHGAQKHALTLKMLNASDEPTVQSLAECVQKQLGVPIKSQKLIHKGKSLDCSATLISYGIKSGSKIMLIGSKYTHEDDPNYKHLSKIDDTVSELHRQLGLLLQEFDGIKKGYLEEKLAEQSVKKLIKKVTGIIEENMKKIEYVDTLKVDQLLKMKRKNLVIKIQSNIDKADKFIMALNKYLVKDNAD
ncbi:uncharacterized protein LOC124445302 [Xenia sp. Carnegie-2017]|uniref:uncharacterized protein LOC124445302 n=1 Tax=Xenia sp. Carnegie-2017 TaxID=2897299 RepID=UPI001F04CA3C|nr:uncharacterized protein LOC124445302 [Xenia sp. Carnegie-2017]